MEKHTTLSDEVFEQQFRSCELEPSMFSHEAHLRLAWIHIHKYGEVQAQLNIQKQIQQFVAPLGATDKYHQTLTVAAVHAVSHFMRKTDLDNFSDFIHTYPQLKANFRALIGSHYSFDVFKSEQARTTFVAPDLMPFS
ncbi:MAG: hypothetical protein AAF985_10835 [Bacteroidota bacterium]